MGPRLGAWQALQNAWNLDSPFHGPRLSVGGATNLEMELFSNGWRQRHHAHTHNTTPHSCRLGVSRIAWHGKGTGSSPSVAGFCQPASNCMPGAGRQHHTTLLAYHHGRWMARPATAAAAG